MFLLLPTFPLHILQLHVHKNIQHFISCLFIYCFSQLTNVELKTLIANTAELEMVNLMGEAQFRLVFSLLEGDRLQKCQPI
jgi:hypothetical protein